MKRHSMQIVSFVLQLVLGLRKSLSETSELMGVSRATCHDIVKRARTAGVGWPLPEGCDYEVLREKLYPWKPRDTKGRLDLEFIWDKMTSSRSSGFPQLTREMLWKEYRQAAEREGKKYYSYSWFCGALAQRAKLTPRKFRRKRSRSSAKV